MPKHEVMLALILQSLNFIFAGPTKKDLDIVILRQFRLVFNLGQPGQN